MRTVRVPPWLLEHEQQETNVSVRPLAAAGCTPAQIAVRLGLEKEVVKRTLRRQKQRGRPTAAV
jgi:IS30 family transposase